MKLILPAVILGLFAVWCLWNASLARLLRRLGARPAAHFPVWRQVRARLEELSRRGRFGAPPSLWILPDFAPNALVATTARGRVHVALTEGLLRALEDAELDAVLNLCLAHGAGGRRRWQTRLALQLFPFAAFVQSRSPAAQVFLSPWLTAVLRMVSPPTSVLAADRRGGDALAIAAALQKMAVLGRKIPLRHWNFALDPLFLVSPLALDGGPFWVFLSQPSVEERRRALLALASCESSAGL